MSEEYWRGLQSGAVTRLDELLDTLRTVSDVTTPEGVDLDALVAGAEYVRTRALLVDPRLVSVRTWESLESFTLQLRNHVKRGSAADPEQISNYYTAMTGEVFLPLPLGPAGEADVVQSVGDRLSALWAGQKEREASAAAANEALRAELDMTSERLGELQQEIGRLRAEADAEFTKSVSGADHRLDEIQSRGNDELTKLIKRIETDETRVDAAIQAYQTSFGEAESQRRNDFADQLHEQLGDFQAARGDFDVRGGDLLGRLGEHEEKAREIVGFAAAAGHAEAFVLVATAQRKAADMWQRIAFGSLIAAGIVGLVLVFALGDPGGSTEAIIQFALERLTFPVGFGGAAIYAARQSGGHRRREVAAQQMANDLSTFRPFIAELDPEIRKDMTRDATLRYFVGAPETNKVRKAPPPPS